MARLVTLQGTGGGRIPMGGFSYDVSRRDLAALIDALPSETCRALHLAVRQGDVTLAQRLMREAAATYYAAPAAPPPPCRQKRPPRPRPSRVC